MRVLSLGGKIVLYVIVTVVLISVIGPFSVSATTLGNSVTVTNNLTVNGATNLTGAVTAVDSVSTTMTTSSRHLGVGVIDSSNANWDTGSLNVGHRLSVDGATYVSSTLHVSGNARFYGTLAVDGVVTVGGVSSTSGVYPSTTNLYDIGSYTAAWRSLYVSTTAFIGVLVVGDSSAGSILSGDNANVDIGSFGRAFNNIFVSSTFYGADDLILTNQADTSTIFVNVDGGNVGGQIILKDFDGNGCSVIGINNGTIDAAPIACPTIDAP